MLPLTPTYFILKFVCPSSIKQYLKTTKYTINYCPQLVIIVLKSICKNQQRPSIGSLCDSTPDDKKHNFTIHISFAIHPISICLDMRQFISRQSCTTASNKTMTTRETTRETTHRTVRSLLFRLISSKQMIRMTIYMAL